MFRLSIKIQQDEFVLHGTGIAAPLRGCVRQPTQRLPSGLCLEKLDLVSQGTPYQSRTLIIRLQTLVERIRLGHTLYLVCQTDEQSEPYQSRLFAGEFSWILGSVQPKGIGIRLELQREDYWHLPWRPLALNNCHGNGVLDGLQMDNRDDNPVNRQNWCWLAGEDLLGDLPAPLRLHLHHDLQSINSLDAIYIGLGSARITPLAVLEGEQGSSQLNFGAVMNADCHAGAYGLVQWESSAALRILSWVIPGAAFHALARAQLRPLVRLVNPSSLRAETWLSWKLYFGSLVFQSAARQLTVGRQLQLLPIICLPALSNSEVPWNDLRLELHAQNRNPGATHLALDAVFLFFTDGWRQFTALPDGKLAYGETLIDQSDQQQPYIHLAQTQTNQQSYQVLGNGLWLLPGEDHVLQVLFDNGQNMPLDAGCHVQLEYQPRTRMLP
ncbi:MAG: hypothetical protein Q7U53_01360 [Anaerolineaceae bacterium]|nr:hypothetical protein [Anaerolineaceae bacterium]